MRRVMFFVVLMVLFFVYEVRGGLFDGVFTNFFDENGIQLKGGNVDNNIVDNNGRLAYRCYYDSGMWLYSVAYGYGSRDKWRDFVKKIKEGKKAGNGKREYDNGLYLNGYLTGVDCSGFVQSFWELYFSRDCFTNKLYTTDLHRVSYRIPIWQIMKYDVLNSFGCHVVLFDRFDNSGNFGYSDLTSCYVYESGSGSRLPINYFGRYMYINPSVGVRYGKPGYPAIRTPFYKTNITKAYLINNYGNFADITGSAEYSNFVRSLANISNNDETNILYMYLVGRNGDLADEIITKSMGNTMTGLNNSYLVYRFGLDDVPPMVEVDVSNESIGNWNISIKVKDTQCAGIRVLDTTSKKINVLTNAFRVSLVGVGEIRNVFGITNFVESYNGGPMVYRSYKNGNTVINSEGVRLQSDGEFYSRSFNLKFDGVVKLKDGSVAKVLSGKYLVKVECEDFNGNRGVGTGEISLGYGDDVVRNVGYVGSVVVVGLREGESVSDIKRINNLYDRISYVYIWSGSEAIEFSNPIDYDKVKKFVVFVGFNDLGNSFDAGRVDKMRIKFDNNKEVSVSPYRDEVNIITNLERVIDTNVYRQLLCSFKWGYIGELSIDEVFGVNCNYRMFYVYYVGDDGFKLDQDPSTPISVMEVVKNNITSTNWYGVEMASSDNSKNAKWYTITVDKKNILDKIEVVSRN